MFEGGAGYTSALGIHSTPKKSSAGYANIKKSSLRLSHSFDDRFRAPEGPGTHQTYSFITAGNHPLRIWFLK
jgi:hypothetical protein